MRCDVFYLVPQNSPSRKNSPKHIRGVSHQGKSILTLYSNEQQRIESV